LALATVAPDKPDANALRLISSSLMELHEMSELTAYHEAGHAWMAVLTGARVVSVTIEPDWDDGPERYGDTQVAWQRSRFSERELTESGVLVSLAGPVAEMAYHGDPYHPGFVAEWAEDWRAAWDGAAALLAKPSQRMAYLESETAKLRRLLDQENHWAAVAEIADQLLAHDRLEAEDVAACVRQWL